MKIQENTEMMLFRYSNYRKNMFIEAHQEVLKENGFAWMLKIGKRSSVAKIEAIIKSGGWLVLRAPKADGSKSYIAKFTEISEEEPMDFVYPAYYTEILDNEDEDEYYNPNAVYQWFKLKCLVELSEEEAKHLIVSKTGKPVNEVIGTTRTAVMFIRNNKEINV